jgi:dethiobiotin synthetase
MTKQYFITGTGTNIGKTYITCKLIRNLIGRGGSVAAIKPIISGVDASNINISDTVEILQALGLPPTQKNIEKISPWRLKFPLSPDIAAQKEGKIIDFAEVIKFCESVKSANEYLFIEGAGGVMTPITPGKAIADLISALKIPVILVGGTYLGAISHTLTTIKTLESYGIKIEYLIVNQSEDCACAKDIIKSLQRFTNLPIVFVPLGGSLDLKDKNGIYRSL